MEVEGQAEKLAEGQIITPWFKSMASVQMVNQPEGDTKGRVVRPHCLTRESIFPAEFRVNIENYLNWHPEACKA